MLHPDAANQDELDRLRALLLESDRRELEDMRARLDALENIRDRMPDLDPDEILLLRARLDELESRFIQATGRTEQISEVLPQAIHHRRRSRNDLTEALRPDVEQALHDSIRSDPTVMAEALYPVMGPTIRKLIVSLFSFDQMRPGAKYEVSHAYLIDRRTSLPLAVYAPDDDELEADMVSGMMEALRSFVQDAFEASDFDGLHDLRVGDVNLCIEWGPKAVLAVVVRGMAPNELRLGMQECLERFHRDYSIAIDGFTGDPTPFAPMTDELRDLTGRLSAKAKPSPVKVLVPILVLLAVVAGIVALIWYLAT